VVPVPYEDQVPRLQAFQAAHPAIRIDNPVDSRSGFWSAHQDGKVPCAELELYQLLDRLEWLLEQR
jgi:hypothetical protein